MGKAIRVRVDHSRGVERWRDDEKPAFVTVSETVAQSFGLLFDRFFQQCDGVRLYNTHFRASPLMTVNGMDSVDVNEVHLNGLVYSVFKLN